MRVPGDPSPKDREDRVGYYAHKCGQWIVLQCENERERAIKSLYGDSLVAQQDLLASLEAGFDHGDLRLEHRVLRLDRGAARLVPSGRPRPRPTLALRLRAITSQ